MDVVLHTKDTQRTLHTSDRIFSTKLLIGIRICEQGCVKVLILDLHWISAPMPSAILADQIIKLMN